MTMPKQLTRVLAALAIPCAALAACNNSCVVRGTRIRTPRGETLVEEVAVGTEVVAFDTQRGVAITRTVVGVIVGESQEIFTITSGTRTLRVTAVHPFWVPERRSWVRAADLAVGEVLLQLVAEDGRAMPARIDAIERTFLDAPIAVFDITVGGGEEHDFFAEGILVHNKDPGTIGCGVDITCSSPDAAEPDDARSRADVIVADAEADTDADPIDAGEDGSADAMGDADAGADGG